MSSDPHNAPITRDEATCRTCVHYDTAIDRVDDRHGQCKRHAPAAITTKYESPEDVFYAQWPWVPFFEKCGDWKWDESLEAWIDNPDQKDA